jgi:hypothetical protein
MKTLQKFSSCRPQSTTTNATTSVGISTGSDARPRWPSGWRSWPTASWVWAHCAQKETSCPSTDSILFGHHPGMTSRRMLTYSRVYGSWFRQCDRHSPPALCFLQTCAFRSGHWPPPCGRPRAAFRGSWLRSRVALFPQVPFCTPSLTKGATIQAAVPRQRIEGTKLSILRLRGHRNGHSCRGGSPCHRLIGLSCKERTAGVHDRRGR